MLGNDHFTTAYEECSSGVPGREPPLMNANVIHVEAPPRMTSLVSCATCNMPKAGPNSAECSTCRPDCSKFSRVSSRPTHRAIRSRHTLYAALVLKPRGKHCEDEVGVASEKSPDFLVRSHPERNLWTETVDVAMV